MMRGKLQNLWENVRSSLWFIPTLLVALAILGSLLLIELDVVLAQRRSLLIPWLFSGTADAARTLLSVVAGSLITVISIAISLTIVALVQASAQFTPRILRQFTASRANQVVLGTYTATFVYALLVLRTVRSAEEGDAPFVPALSVTTAVLLALLCLALLIYFIHHMSQSLQVSVIIDEVRQELLTQIDKLYPQALGREVPDPPAPATLREALQHNDQPVVVRSEKAGFVRHIDEQTLLSISLASTQWLSIRPQIGEFVASGSILVELDQVEGALDAVSEQIRRAFVIDRERTITQDPLFGIRQLVDIGLKALSPGINDMTTAEYVLYHLDDAIGRLAGRTFPSPVRTTDSGCTQIIVNRPTWDQVVDAAFSQIREAAADDVHVTQTLLQVLYDLAQRLPPGPRTHAIQQQLVEIRYNIAQNAWSPNAKAHLLQKIAQVEYELQTWYEPSQNASPVAESA